MTKYYLSQRLGYMIACLLVGVLLLPTVVVGQEVLTLSEAITANQLEATIKGRAATFIQPMMVMEARNLTDQSLTVQLPIGAILNSTQGNYCDVVVLQTDPDPVYFAESSAAPLVFQLHTYCLDLVHANRKFPTIESLYYPSGSLASEQVIATLYNIQQEQGQDTFAAQLAIWSAASGKSLAQLQQDMDADYSLYGPLVEKYLGSAAPQPTQTITEVPSSTEEVAGGDSSTASASASQFNGFWIVMIFIGTLGAVLLAMGLGIFPKASKMPHEVAATHNAKPVGASDRKLSGTDRSPPPGRAPPTLGAPHRSIEKTAPINPDSHSIKTSAVSEPRDSQFSGSSTSQSAQTVRSQRDARHEETAPQSPEEAVVHERTQPIDVTIHQPTDPNSVTEDDSDWLTLKVLAGDQKGKEHELPGLEGVISRGSTGQVCIPDAKVSTPHAILDISSPFGGRDRVRDLSSTNGTLQNGRKMPPNQWQTLNDGDVLQFGLVKLRYEQARRQLVSEDPSSTPHKLLGNNRWLVTRRELYFVDFESHDNSISVPHAYIRRNQGRLELRDLSSGGGIIVQGQKIHERELIFNEEVIRIGRDTEFQITTNIKAMPEEIGDWIRLSWRGAGGMADVYRVRHKHTGEVCALKMPNPSIRFDRKPENQIIRKEV